MLLLSQYQLSLKIPKHMNSVLHEYIHIALYRLLQTESVTFTF